MEAVIKEQAEVQHNEEEFVAMQNPYVDLLRNKIQFHTQIMNAYNLLHKFESESYSDVDDEDDMMNDPNTNQDDHGGAAAGAMMGAPRSKWAEEATAWIDTYEITNKEPNIMVQSPPPPSSSNQILSFSKFAKACMLVAATSSSNQNKVESAMDDCRKKKRPKLMIGLCDSTKDRVAVLVHVFKPLKKDIFVFKVVNSVFDNLGITKDYARLQVYFGEWFMTLPAKEAAQSSLFDMWCPILRWLQDMITSAFDEQDKLNKDNETTTQNSTSAQNALLTSASQLQSLQTFCSEADDLPRAFLLAVVCREAVFIATKRPEARTYGKVLSKVAVQPWDTLLRKLRVCLLLSNRLAYEETPLGPCPISVSNIDSQDLFSIFEWVARDELYASHKQDEIVNLEDACRNSFQSFHPSLKEGDVPKRWKALHRPARSKNGSERASRLILSDMENQAGPLLLYFSEFNCPVELAAHRALLLGGKWGQKPASLHLIKDAVSALRVLEAGEATVDERARSIAAAVRMEIWQSRIRPVYRALLFGFHDVPELSEEIFFPLCQDNGWLRGLAKVAADILMLIERTAASTAVVSDSASVHKPNDNDHHHGMMDHVDEEGFAKVNKVAPSDEENDLTTTTPWPPVTQDITLTNLLKRSRPIETSALEIHQGIICAAQFTNDLSTLSLCVPHDVFMHHSLSIKMNNAPSSSTTYQTDFLNRALDKKASMTKGLVDHFDLGNVEKLGRTWGIPPRNIRSRFILAMYRAGKDAMVDELTNASSTGSSAATTTTPSSIHNSNNTLLDTEEFIEQGLEIACMRLQTTILMLKKVKRFRSIIGMLDADTCQFVKEQSEIGIRAQEQRKKEQQEQQHVYYSPEEQRQQSEEDDTTKKQPPSLSATHELIMKLLRMSSSSSGGAAYSEKAQALSVLSGALLNAVLEEEKKKDLMMGNK